MMKRVVTGLLLAGLTIPAVGASAAKPAVACDQLADPPDDAYIALNGAFIPLTGPSDPDLDIRAVAVATGKKTLVIRLKVTSTNPADDPWAKSPTDHNYWRVDFTIDGVAYQAERDATYLPVKSEADKVSYEASGRYVPLAGVTMKVTASSFTWIVPRKSVPALKVKRAVFANFAASAYGPPSTDDGTAATTANYVDKQRSCLNPK